MEALYVEALYVEALYVEALYVEALYVEALLRGSALRFPAKLPLASPIKPNATNLIQIKIGALNFGLN